MLLSEKFSHSDAKSKDQIKRRAKLASWAIAAYFFHGGHYKKKKDDI